jgi:hypothetical protein
MSTRGQCATTPTRLRSIHVGRFRNGAPKGAQFIYCQVVYEWPQGVAGRLVRVLQVTGCLCLRRCPAQIPRWVGTRR